MSGYVVIALSPSVDVSQVVGPFRSADKAREISDELTSKGYNTELCPLMQLSEVDDSPAWDYSPELDWQRS